MKPDEERAEEAWTQVGTMVFLFDHFDKGHDVGMRHEDGSLYSASCHDCKVFYDRPDDVSGVSR